MKQIKFYKYQGTGNDFILIDNRKGFVKLSSKKIALLCNRNFGIGADGLMLLQNKKGYDFEMVYFNSDGNKSSMCGNGGRCIVMFAYNLNIIKQNVFFWAPDGAHRAEIKKDSVKLKMIDCALPVSVNKDHFIDTGSPHYVKFSDQLNKLDVYVEGKKIRYNKRFADKGTNVNFVDELKDGTIAVRTYERGVEDETLSCGTGVTAAAIVYSSINNYKFSKVNIETAGGKLQVFFRKMQEGLNDVWLLGKAEKTFEGTITI
jgi:diaminopimelate epimerase